MDAVVKNFPKAAASSAAAPEKSALSDHVRAAPEPILPRPSREEAEAASEPALTHDSSTNALIRRYRARRGVAP